MKNNPTKLTEEQFDNLVQAIYESYMQHEDMDMGDMGEARDQAEFIAKEWAVQNNIHLPGWPLLLYVYNENVVYADEEKNSVHTSVIGSSQDGRFYVADGRKYYLPKQFQPAKQ